MIFIDQILGLSLHVVVTRLQAEVQEKSSSIAQLLASNEELSASNAGLETKAQERQEQLERWNKEKASLKVSEEELQVGKWCCKLLHNCTAAIINFFFQ